MQRGVPSHLLISPLYHENPYSFQIPGSRSIHHTSSTFELLQKRRQSTISDQILNQLLRLPGLVCSSLPVGQCVIWWLVPGAVFERAILFFQLDFVPVFP